MSPRTLSLTLALSLTALVGTASAQPAEDVESLHRRGVALREEGRAAEALALFQRAHALRPEPRSLVRMALAEAELGRWAEADAHLSAAVETPHDRFVRQHRRDLDAELTGIRGHVGRLDLQSSTPGVVISLNGADPIPVPSTPLRVVEGSLHFELRAPGCQTVRRTLSITPRSTSQVIVQLECDAPAVAAAPAAPRPAVASVAPPVVPPPTSRVFVRPPAAVPSRRGELRTAAWVTAGVAVAFLGAGAVATGLGSAAAARWNSDACLGAQRTRGETCADDADTAVLMRPLALVGFVAGGLVAATSAALFIVSRDRPPTATAWRCGQGPGTVGLSCGASF